MDRTAEQLSAAAGLASLRGDLMRGRRRRREKMLHRAECYSARLEIANRRLGVREPCASRDRALLRAQLPFVGKPGEVNDGLYISPRFADPPKQREVGHWLNKLAWNMRMCGRTAVGVGLIRRQGDSQDKVYHQTCKDWMCPACNARRMAHEAPALKQLLTGQFNQGERLFFATLTVRHKYHDQAGDTRAVLDRAWSLLIRRRWFRETFDERLRVAEAEFTKRSGFHPHFHLLLRLKSGCRAGYWSRDKVYAKLCELWRGCTATAGRESWKLDLRELVAVRNDQGEVECIRYWLRPEERARFEQLERDGVVKLYRRGEHLSREQSLDDVVDELCKYVTKRHGNAKSNQIPLDRWKPWMVLEYRVAMRYWNRRRASKGWEQQLLEAKEAAELQREIELDQQGGYEYLPWAAIVSTCRDAARHNLSAEQADRFAADYPRILAALETGGCDVSADMIRGYIFRFFGDSQAPLQKLSLQPWELTEWREDELARKVAEAQAQGNLKARHWRVLLRLRRRHDDGHDQVKLSGLGMSRRRLRAVVEDLQAQELLSTSVDGKGRDQHALTEHGRRLIPSRLPDPRIKHAQRKALRELQRVMPGLIWSPE